MLSKLRSLFNRDDANPWLFVLIFTTILAAPAGILNKLLSTELDPLVITTVRYGLVAAILLPFLFKNLKQYKTALAKKLKIILLSGAFFALGAPAYVTAVSMVNVSFIAILDMLTPILFVIISTLVTKDKLTRNAFIGILFAILGGSIILVLPMFFDISSMTGIALLPLLLIILYMLTDATFPVMLRKLNTGGLPLMPMLAIFFSETFVISAILALTVHGPQSFTALTNLPIWGWVALLFMSVGLSVAFRWLNTKSYEHLGTATTASVNYLYYALAIGLPLVLLGEEMPFEVVIGGVFIVIGIIFVRRHPHPHLHRPHSHM
jgi:drug/metabolite transporter (DMT)-like permease